jgi:hypothetical protein
MIEDVPKTCFLARPRRLGKSLTVSTFETIFSGQKELFKGLAIENRLGEETFAPRPAIPLDMSNVDSDEVPGYFKKTLARRIHEIALTLEIRLRPKIRRPGMG